MLERSLEILVRLCAHDLFPADWELIAQQLALPSGRLDMLFADSDNRRHVVELKKGRARTEAVDQVARYADDLRSLVGEVTTVPWVVAHDIPDDVSAYANRYGCELVRCRSNGVTRFIRERGLTEADLLGVRRAAGVLHGGGAKGGLRHPVSNEEAFGVMPADVGKLLTIVAATPHFEVRSGGMQTVIHYRGVKLGGVNRKHRGGVGYISEGVVIDAGLAAQLADCGFRRMTKVQSGSSHEHVWWEVSWSQVDAIKLAIERARATVDRALRVP